MNKKVIQNRSKEILLTVNGRFLRMSKDRLARECSKLDPAFEKALAEEWIHSELPEC
jgi:hypothetical protein